MWNGKMKSRHSRFSSTVKFRFVRRIWQCFKDAVRVLRNVEHKYRIYKSYLTRFIWIIYKTDSRRRATIFRFEINASLNADTGVLKIFLRTNGNVSKIEAISVAVWMRPYKKHLTLQRRVYTLPSYERRWHWNFLGRRLFLPPTFFFIIPSSLPFLTSCLPFTPPPLFFSVLTMTFHGGKQITRTEK